MPQQENTNPLNGKTAMSTNLKTWLDWDALVKRTVARFARGNIAAQHGRILFPEEQERERVRVTKFVRAWKKRAERDRAAQPKDAGH